MTNLVELLKKLLRDVVLFVRYASGLKLRGYQEVVARAVVHSVLHQQGLSFVVIFPRQSGKNELQAQLQSYFLTLLANQPVEMVQVSPTWRPQTENAMHRLEGVLSKNLILKDRWQKHHGHIYQVGQARLTFLSGSPSANIVGATANLLLSVDEAQDIQLNKYDKEIAPMAASTNATRVFWGTAWTSNTLLAREENAALAQQDIDGLRRVWRINVDDIAVEVPAYGKFVAEQVSRLGRSHPMVKTQYYSEDIDTEGGLFPPERLALLYGSHPAHRAPQPGCMYAMTLDVAGEDECDSQNLDGLNNPARDATAITICEVIPGSPAFPGTPLPHYRIVFRQQWLGIKHVRLYQVLLSLAETWGIKTLVCDATGIGAGLSAFLSKALGSKVLPFVFNSRSKSDLGWAFLALVDGGRLKDYAPQADQPGCLASLHALFFQQLQHTQFTIIPGPEKRMRWGVPDGSRDLATGAFVHDDLVICAALISQLDGQSWSTTGPSVVVTAHDPLEDMKGY